MSQKYTVKELSTEQAFFVIERYRNLRLSELLTIILQEKQVKVKELYQKLNDCGYYLSLESLYRYFNSNPQSNRFPPEDFIQTFAKVLQLDTKESKLLHFFWQYCQKYTKKCYSK